MHQPVEECFPDAITGRSYIFLIGKIDLSASPRATNDPERLTLVFYKFDNKKL
jgi:hypothetical protein